MWGIRIHNLTKLFVIWGGLRILASILSPFAGCVVKLSSACIGNIWTRQTNFSSAYIYITPQYNNCLKEAEIISCAFEVKKDITNNVVLVELCFFFFASVPRPFILGLFFPMLPRLLWDFSRSRLKQRGVTSEPHFIQMNAKYCISTSSQSLIFSRETRG